jgi:aspartate kinase
MRILIQKFGGTSVSTPERRSLVVEKVIKARNEGYATIVVVSAMGRRGEPYATDTLLSLLSNSFKENNLLVTDLLMCCGEIISSVVMSEELSKANIKSIPLTGGQAGIITDDSFGNAALKRVDTENLLRLLKEGIVPVVTGFQGITPDGYFTTLGRGGSDVTAAILGSALRAEKVEIFTDVDGIMTADPRIVKDAALIKKISYNEVFQFADQGAKVIHPRAVEIAMSASITLAIKNTMNDCEGTLIGAFTDNNIENIITGITHMDNRLQIKISQNENIDNKNYYSVLEILAKNSISIDLINVFPQEQIFTVDSKNKKYVDEIMHQLGLKYSFTENCSKIAIIGSGMRGIPGVMARILKAIYAEDIEVFQTADSHTTIWCLVESKNAQNCINALHKEFKLGN